MIEDKLASPSQVMAQFLIDNQWGVEGGSVKEIDAERTLYVDPPQIYVSSVPDDVNYVIFLKKIAGRYFGRDPDGRRWKHAGVHMMVRHPNDDGGSLAESLEEWIGMQQNFSVTIRPYSYMIQTIYQSKDFMQIGEDVGRLRQMWTADFFIAFQWPARVKLEED